MREKEKLNQLIQILESMESVVIGFSGGVDSTFLVSVAKDVLADKVLAVTAASCFFSERELNEAIAFAKDLHIRHKIVNAEVLDIDGLSENPKNRCYLCKKELFAKMVELAKREGLNFVADGANVDDASDYRPGTQATRELGIRSPLVEAGLTKNDIRVLSNERNLPTWDKPSFACLASRIPYGQEITKEKLHMIDEAEQYLIDHGFKQVRIRHHGETARIEVAPEERPKFFSMSLMDDVAKRLDEIGFKYVTLDLKGYRTGSLNEIINRE